MKMAYQLLLLIGLSGITFSAVGQISFQSHTVLKPFSRSAGLGLSDLDSDGDVDILAGSGTAGLYWFENQGGKPVQWVTHVVDQTIRGCLSVRAADIDRDGHNDMVTCGYDDNSVFWYRNLGNGSFEEKLIDNSCGEVHEVYVWDIDGDGLLDVMAAAVTRNEIVWYRNPGAGSQTWTKQVLSNTFGGSRSVSACDLDGDGKPEIVGAAFDGDKITVWKNGGGIPIAWQAVDLVTGYNGAHRVHISDLNQDGKPDIIGWAYMAGTLDWWENTGPDFTAWTHHVVDNQLVRSCVGESKDIDLDGDLDIVSTGYDSNQVVWYENTDGKATNWKKHTIDATLVEPWMAFADDLDGDLDIDVVAGGDEGGEIRWYENQTDGRFDTFIPTSVGNVKTGIFVPENYDEHNQYKLVISLHGSGEEKYASSLRDLLIPVTEQTGAIIVSPNLPGAEAPDYSWTHPSLVGEILSHALQRFSIDPAAVYLMGAGCQGKPAMELVLSGEINIKGAIAVNPLIPVTSEVWGTAAAAAIVEDQSATGYPVVEQLADNLWKEGRRVRLFRYDGNGVDYMIDELPDLVIRSMNYVDSAHLLTQREEPTTGGSSLSASWIGDTDHPALLLKGLPGEKVEIRMYNPAGNQLAPPVGGTLTDGTGQISIPYLSALKQGLYFIRILGSNSRSCSLKIFRSANRT